jgi:HD-GYP domain-containing protein (c-di-GMP phosphodiesterase class II)
MTTPRPYAAERGEEAALEELRRCAGTQFDPYVVDALQVVLASRVVAPPTRSV